MNSRSKGSSKAVKAQTRRRTLVAFNHLRILDDLQAFSGKQQTFIEEQQHLIEAQEKLLRERQILIEAQEKLLAERQVLVKAQQTIIDMTPKNVPDNEVYWHIATGIMSYDVMKSESLEVVERFNDWLTEFGHKLVKPYVNQRVYIEVMNQMRRGLSERIAELKTDRALNGVPIVSGHLKLVDERTKADDKPPKQPALFS